LIGPVDQGLEVPAAAIAEQRRKRAAGLDSSGEDRNRTPAENAGETGDRDESGAECGAVGARVAEIDPDLAAVVDAWPGLSDAIKAGILAMVRAARE